MRLAIPLFLLLSVLSGCSRSNVTATTQTIDPIAVALLRSGAVRHYISSIDSKWSYLRDDAVDGGVIVAVGENREDCFTRGLTAKVMDDGSVFVLTPQNHGEEVWKPG